MLPVHHLKQITGNFLFRKFYCENLTRGDLEDAEVPVVCGDEGELRGKTLVYEVGIEDVELVSLHNLRRRVVEVVVGLVVLVPLEPGVNTIEIPGKCVVISKKQRLDRQSLSEARKGSHKRRFQTLFQIAVISNSCEKGVADIVIRFAEEEAHSCGQ